MRENILQLISIVIIILCFSASTFAFTLKSTSSTPGGTGFIYGPGGGFEAARLSQFEIRHIAFDTTSELFIPREIAGSFSSDFCAMSSFATEFYETGNHNILWCPEYIGSKKVAIISKSGSSSRSNGNLSIIDGNLQLSVELQFIFLDQPHKPVKMYFLATTGDVRVPEGIDDGHANPSENIAGPYNAGDKLEGRIGDEDGDGWLDGELVYAGNMPMDSPFYPGQPFAIKRTFEIDIPSSGIKLGNVKEIQANEQVYPQRLIGSEGER